MPWTGSVTGDAAIFDGALARRHEAGEDAQKGRLAGPRFAEDRDDLAVAQREVDMVEHQPAEMVGRAIGLGDGFGAQQRDGHRSFRVE